MNTRELRTLWDKIKNTFATVTQLNTKQNSVFVVNLTETGGRVTTISADKTFSEIQQAYADNKDIICKLSGVIYRLTTIDNNSASFSATFVSSGLNIKIYSVSNRDEWSSYLRMVVVE